MIPQSRRQFVKFVALGTAFSSVPGRFWESLFVTEAAASSGSPTTPGVIKLRVSDFPVLSEPLGSVRLGPNSVRPDEFPDGLIYPIIISKDETGAFFAVDSECRHANCTVQPWSTDTFTIKCYCHGSEYAMDGTVLEGPATENLGRYDIEYDGEDTLIVHVPKFGFRVEARPVHAAPEGRLRLEFPSLEYSRYVVLSRQRVTEEWEPVSFASSVEGSFDLEIIEGTGESLAVYVPLTGSTGFFTVQLRVSEV